MLLAFGFKTYFVRVSTRESAVKGTKITTLSPTKTFPKHVKEDIHIENYVMRKIFECTHGKYVSFSSVHSGGV